jgi:hypothetical protein
VGKPEGDVHFDLDRVRLDTEDRSTAQAREHVLTQCKIAGLTDSFEIPRD